MKSSAIKFTLLALLALIVAMLTSCGSDGMTTVPVVMTVSSVKMVQRSNSVPNKLGGFDEVTVDYYLCGVEERGDVQFVTKTHVSCGDKVSLLLTLRNGWGAEVLQ